MQATTIELTFDPEHEVETYPRYPKKGEDQGKATLVICSGHWKLNKLTLTGWKITSLDELIEAATALRGKLQATQDKAMNG